MSIKSRRIRWEGYVACMRNRSGGHGLEGRPEGKRPVQNLGIDGRIILTQIFMKWNGGAGTGLIWLRIGTGGELL